MNSDAEETGTVKDALDAIKADIKNEYTARNEYFNALSDDVYKPLLQLKDHYAQNNRRVLSYLQKRKKKKKCRLDAKRTEKKKNTIQEATVASNQLFNAQNSGVTSTQVLKVIAYFSVYKILRILYVLERGWTQIDIEYNIAARSTTATQSQQQWKERDDEDHADWSRENARFNEELTVILQGMEANEFSRLQAVGDCLRKWAVFTTNVCANRNYDIQSLAQVMSLVKPEQDLQAFMAETLAKFPPVHFCYLFVFAVVREQRKFVILKIIIIMYTHILCIAYVSQSSENINLNVGEEMTAGYDLGSFSRQSFSTSLTAESKSVDGPTLGIHHLSHTDVEGHAVIKTNPISNNNNHRSSITHSLTDQPQDSTNSISKLFTGFKLSRRVR
ncbi:hypothetical protein RFI_03015 [Reticulomyxa filosa]|uniref:Uncharacterized protein n=1 Tax=Reticulomyxa filosa TaxID=46433 RepID=X6P794_RETFI|nr:hypothetical protein RFI_03015 [Reticulomyxa filosa]|eukprot:ETO34081.1 hypothetical protein RFI_03015 [Reticulomyxa filosa]